MIMSKTLEEILSSRPVSRRRVDAHKRRMVRDVNTYKLRELREALNLTQVEMAERLKVSQNRVSRLEQGDVERSQVDTLRRYVEALGCTLHVEIEYDGERIDLA